MRGRNSKDSRDSRSIGFAETYRELLSATEHERFARVSGHKHGVALCAFT